MAIGAVALWLAVRFDYRKLRRFSPLIMLVTIGLLFVVLVPGLGVHAMGSSRWVGFGQFRLQPSELMKLALTLFAADFITRRLDEDAADRRIIGPLLIVTGFACVLILAQPDMGTAMVLGFIALALLFVSGVRLGPVMKVMAALVGPRPHCRRGLALPSRPAAVVHGPLRPQLGVRLPGHAVAHRAGVGPLRRFRPGWRAGAVGLPPERAHRLHLLGHRRGARDRRRTAGARPPGRLHVAGHPGRGAVGRPLRRPGLPGPGGLGRGGDPHQRGCGGGRAARHRHSASVHLLRRLVTGDHHGGGRHPDQCRPAGRGAELHCGSPGRAAGPPARPEVGERPARHGDCGRWDGRSHRPFAADRARPG